MIIMWILNICFERNLLNHKINLNNAQIFDSKPQRTNSVAVMDTSRLMLFRQIRAVYCVNYSKQIKYSLCADCKFFYCRKSLYMQ
jgi:hypothetical protein